jgi:hypothetical protein
MTLRPVATSEMALNFFPACSAFPGFLSGCHLGFGRIVASETEVPSVESDSVSESGMKWMSVSDNAIEP